MERLACAAVLFCATGFGTLHAQWTIQHSHTTAGLRGIHAVGNGVAWASGTEGTVLRTTNDGRDWQRCAAPPEAEHLDFRGVQAFDANTAIVMSSGKGTKLPMAAAVGSSFSPTLIRKASGTQSSPQITIQKA